MARQALERVVLFCSLLAFAPVHADLKSQWGSFKDTVVGIGDGFKSFGKGMAESFGMNPPGYEYSFRVFNNASQDIRVEARRVKTYQGIKVRQGTIGKEVTLKPCQDTGETGFSGVGLYLDVVLKWADGEYVNSITKLAAQRDKTLYHYNVFETQAGILGEILGKGYTTTDQFLASLYNSLDITQTVTFTYAGQTFTTFLEPQSYNILQSDRDIPNCIRPATEKVVLDFGKAGTIPLFSQGLATGKEDKGQWTDVMPVQYHFEIVQAAESKGAVAVPRVVTAGLNPGNYSQPTNQRLRSVTPLRCLVWNSSAEQAMGGPLNFNTGKVLTELSVDEAGRSVWVVYSTPGWSNKTAGVADVCMAQVPLGKALEFYVMRPLIDGTQHLEAQELLATTAIKLDPSETAIDASPLKKSDGNPKDFQLPSLDLYETVQKKGPQTNKAVFYIVSLDTQDSKKAQQFLQNLIAGKIVIPPAPSLDSFKTSGQLTDEVKSSLFFDKLAEGQGKLIDAQSGVSGYILNRDIFTPYGGSQGPYYYTVYPAKATVTNVYTHSLGSYLRRTEKDQSGNMLIAQEDQIAAYRGLAQWISEGFWYTSFDEKVTALKPQVEKFLQEKGIDALFKMSSGRVVDKTQFSSLGIQALGTILTGPNSVTRAPVVRFPGTNHYVYTYGAMPAHKDAVTGKQVVVWKPSATVDLAGKVVSGPPVPTVH